MSGMLANPMVCCIKALTDLFYDLILCGCTHNNFPFVEPNLHAPIIGLLQEVSDGVQDESLELGGPVLAPGRGKHQKKCEAVVDLSGDAP